MKHFVSIKRLLGIATAVLLSLGLLAPLALAAEALPHTGRVVISTGGDVTIPAGDHADAVVVVDGTATIEGEVNTILVIDGTARLNGARTETVLAVWSQVYVGAGTVVLGDVLELDSPIDTATGAVIQGRVSDLGTLLVGIGGVLAGVLFLFWIGFALATIAAGLLLAALAARQVREAERLISREPVTTLAAGLLGLIVTPLLGATLIATIVGAPLGIGILVLLWPFVAFLGYLVAATWVGDWILERTSPGRTRERPYLAAVIGVVVLGALALVPVLAIVGAIASLFGFGAVVLLAWRTIRSRSATQSAVPGSAPAPIPG